ncbi:hypothetical protein CDL15_Pgr022583 [Punica granatum]|uniref:Uncharacterized protein n=1 Tax=Punica granatum TaxID=22663 RepID=A0A218XT94_PUNGR|nr:hypothetical protein CDL15_Pgr022583 [Punica granatum]
MLYMRSSKRFYSFNVEEDRWRQFHRHFHPLLRLINFLEEEPRSCGPQQSSISMAQLVGPSTTCLPRGERKGVRIVW